MIRLTISLLLLLMSSAAPAQDAPEAEWQSVMTGLRPANAFKGDPTWSLEERMAHYGVPGVGIAVIKDRKVIWHEVVGLADRETGAPVTRDTLFQAGSISKPVSAYGALKMAEDGQPLAGRPGE